MKAVVDIEFVLSVVVFLSAVVFVTAVIINNIPLFRTHSENEDLKARAYEVSQLVMFDSGEPAAWTNVTVKRIGLSNGTRYVLSAIKINYLQHLCTEKYTIFKNLLSQNQTDVKMSISVINGTQLLNCGTQFGKGRAEFQITRFGVLDDGQPVSLTVGVL